MTAESLIASCSAALLLLVGYAANTSATSASVGPDRFNSVIRLPGGDLVYVKVASQDSAGALFMTEQPIEWRGVGPPKHYHEAQDEVVLLSRWGVRGRDRRQTFPACFR
jgi:hypothetical protein